MVNAAKKVLAVASGGGHWVQLRRLEPAFDGHRVTFVTVNEAYRSEVEPQKFYVVGDATRWNKFGLVRLAVQIALVVMKERPEVVVSTGAAPGFFAVWFGKLMGAKTIWIDSIANTECLSLSGEKVGRFADLWLTQWPELAKPGGPEFRGTVL
jgi:UDP-N-acetylglucosamine:LPS N-acetylglucosamine transferase